MPEEVYKIRNDILLHLEALLEIESIEILSIMQILLSYSFDTFGCLDKYTIDVFIQLLILRAKPPTDPSKV